MPHKQSPPLPTSPWKLLNTIELLHKFHTISQTQSFNSWNQKDSQMSYGVLDLVQIDLTWKVHIHHLMRSHFCRGHPSSNQTSRNVLTSSKTRTNRSNAVKSVTNPNSLIAKYFLILLHRFKEQMRYRKFLKIWNNNTRIIYKLKKMKIWQMMWVRSLDRLKSLKCQGRDDHLSERQRYYTRRLWRRRSDAWVLQSAEDNSIKSSWD